MLRTRRRRDPIFGSDLFGEPAWDLLLELYLAELQGTIMTISDACIASVVPSTTAIRWIKVLETRGWIARRDDPSDRRRAFIQLTHRGSTSMQSYLSEVELEPTG